jgi:hypothetical protein
MDFQTYLERVARRKAIHPTERMGQAYFNQLHEDRPDISEDVRGDEIDPFYNDDLIGQFLVFVHLSW